MAINWTATSLMLAVVGFAAGIGAGMGIQKERDAVEPWDDGLLHVECPRGTDKPTFVATARGFAVMDDGDPKHPQPPYVLINYPFDPKLGKSPDDLTFHADGQRWPLGCFVSGVRRKDIVRRGP